ncbi:MAG TPA: serine--tRNA ligase [Bacteroidales bacterium]|nr:serine--tRNA ligase [Bacteroidales bacterium]
MLQLSFIKSNPEKIIELLSIKNFDAKNIIVEILNIDKQRREIQKSLDDTLSEINVISKNIATLIQKGDNNSANEAKKKTASLKIKSKELSEKLRKIELELNELILKLPNVPHFSVPKGKSSEANEIVYQYGDISQFHDNLCPHWDIATKHNIIDFELGSKITGTGFPVYKGKGAKLQRALISFFLDKAIAAGYTEIQPPFIVNEASAYGTGQLPDKDGQMYVTTEDAFYLIPTAEVPVTNLYREVTLKYEDLPIKNVAYSACFRREAGSYGKYVRGLNRLHQFDKVEIVQIQHPDNSYKALEEMVEYVASILKELNLPFRIVKLCGGDISFTSALTYDFEVFSGAQKTWLEVSSVSNFESFQANRMKLKFKDIDGTIKFAHTLNGSALALPRVVAAILENNQKNNIIEIPKVLIPYTGFDTI